MSLPINETNTHLLESTTEVRLGCPFETLTVPFTEKQNNHELIVGDNKGNKKKKVSTSSNRPTLPKLDQ